MFDRNGGGASRYVTGLVIDDCIKRLCRVCRIRIRMVILLGNLSFHRGLIQWLARWACLMCIRMSVLLHG